jgi:hypothetical protein
VSQAFGATGKELLTTFLDKANDYFWDSAGEPLIDGFRIEHPTLEDILPSLPTESPQASPANPKARSIKKLDGNNLDYDWFGYWIVLLLIGLFLLLAHGNTSLPLAVSSFSARNTSTA